MKISAETQKYYLNYIKEHRYEAASYRKGRSLGYDDGPDPIAMDHNIRRIGNHIYFYDGIDPESQMILEQMLRQVTLELLTDHVGDIMNGEMPENIIIHLNSPGGYGHCGLALYDFIKTSRIPIVCVASGMVASAATFIFLAAETRVMSPTSTFLMHQCSWGGEGPNSFMQDLAYNAEKSMKTVINIYMKETDIAKFKKDGVTLNTPEERFEEIYGMLKHDKEFDKTECKQLGIIRAPEKEVQLSEERVELLNQRAEELLREQVEEDAAKDAIEELAEDACSCGHNGCHCEDEVEFDIPELTDAQKATLKATALEMMKVNKAAAEKEKKKAEKSAKKAEKAPKKEPPAKKEKATKNSK